MVGLSEELGREGSEAHSRLNNSTEDAELFLSNPDGSSTVDAPRI